MQRKKETEAPTKSGATMSPPVLLISIDIERGGESVINHPLLAIGVCVGLFVAAKEGGAAHNKCGNRLYRVLEKKTWCLRPFPGQTMEEKCVSEFWSQQQEVLFRIMENSVPPLDALKDFSVWLDGIRNRYASTAQHIEFVSNNPAYDIGTLDFVLCSRGLRTLSIRYLDDGVYRSINDPSEMIYGQNSRDIVNAKARRKASHDHWPENDAEFILWQYAYACEVSGQIKLDGIKFSDD